MEPDIEIIAPDGTVIKFPAGTPDQEIVRVMQENFGGPEDAAYYAEPGMTEDNPIDLTTINRATPEGQALVASLTRGTWVRGADGTVYALPEDAREGVARTGDEPLSPGLMQRPQSAIEDVAKSYPTGVVEGLTGIAGMAGSLRDMIPEGLQSPTSITRFLPSGEDLNQGIRDALGRDYYQPQTVAGEYSRTLGEFMPGALAPGGALTRAASVAVPAVTSETAGQIARGMSGGERDTLAEGLARLGGGLLGGVGVGGVGAVRGGADISLRNAAESVTPQNQQLAAALRRDAQAMGVDLTNAEAIQQVTGGGSGLGRLQRVVEGQTSRMAPMFGQRPAQVQQAIAAELNRLGPNVEPSALAGQTQAAASGVLRRMNQRVNESANPFYEALPGQTVDEGAMAFLNSDPTYQAASRQLMGQPELAALAPAAPNDLSTINRVIQQMDQLEEAATPAMGNTQANRTLSAQRGASGEIAKEIAAQASPDYRMALQTGATGRAAFVDPLARGPIGTLAGQSDARPNLAGQTDALFPNQPFEGQASETAQALQLMGEIDPTVGGPLVRQHLARQAMEAQQDLATGANQFGGANFAARAFGNPEQRRTVMGAIDVTAPPPSPLAFPPLNPNAPQAMPSDPMAQLVEVLQATGQRQRAGSETAFNAEAIQNLRGGNLASGAVKSVTNPLGVPARIGQGVDDFLARRNAETLADLLMANSEDFNARLTRALNRPRGANRIRAAATLGAVQED